jgi:hypothetical protein
VEVITLQKSKRKCGRYNYSRKVRVSVEVITLQNSKRKSGSYITPEKF